MITATRFTSSPAYDILTSIDTLLDNAEATAALFAALADPARVKIIGQIVRCGGACCACEFEPEVGLSQPTVSHHLKKLTDAGLLEREQRGSWAYYRVVPEALGSVRTLLAL